MHSGNQFLFKNIHFYCKKRPNNLQCECVVSVQCPINVRHVKVNPIPFHLFVV